MNPNIENQRRRDKQQPTPDMSAFETKGILREKLKQIVAKSNSDYPQEQIEDMIDNYLYTADEEHRFASDVFHEMAKAHGQDELFQFIDAIIRLYKAAAYRDLKPGRKRIIKLLAEIERISD